MELVVPKMDQKSQISLVLGSNILEIIKSHMHATQHTTYVCRSFVVSYLDIFPQSMLHLQREKGERRKKIG